MSFKTKRWAEMRQVNMADFVPGIMPYKPPGGAGINTRGWAVPFGGKIVVMAYIGNDAIYAIYDPLSHSVDTVQTVDQPWSSYSSSYGWNSYMQIWGDTHLLIRPSNITYGTARERFCGFTPDLGFHDPEILVGERDEARMVPSYVGVADGEPCVVSYQYQRGSGGVPDSDYAMVKTTLAGSSVIYNGRVAHNYREGIHYYLGRYLEGWWQWGAYLRTSPPPFGTPIDEGYVLAANCGHITPLGGASYLQVTPAEGEPYWALASNPLAPVELPWEGYTWEYRRMLRSGGYELDEHDLDGLEHLSEATVIGPWDGPITRMSNGWYCGVNNVESATNFTVYVLDPDQPSKQARTVRKADAAAACYMGDYAIGDDLKLAHVLPFPDERDPDGTSVPPQERRDGYIIGHKELFRRVGSSVRCERGMKVALEGYGFGGDWWYPGENPDHTLNMTLGLFAGTRTIMGRYPHSTYGKLNPAGQWADRGIGVPTENLRAQEPDPTYVVRSDQIIDETMGWVTPGPMNPVGYSFLRGSLTDARLCYHELYVVGGSPPQWHARGGLVQGDEWHDLLNLDAMDMPELGQDGWTIYGLCPIPRCRGLRKGGWLVCAQLYFAPWTVWEWEAGPRDLTFRSTGNGWVPAKKGYIGPLEIEDWHPRLLSGYDEWTFNRSDYGPAALLVYDDEGEFVECLNDENMYPPQAGPEVAVLPGSVPRLIYRVKGGGTYSDCAEYWDCYQNNSGEADFQAPLFAVYELERSGRIQVGAGAFLGFVDMYELERYETRDAGWRWGALAAALDWQYPKNIWAPYSRVKIREGVGGSGLTLLSPRGMSTRSGVNGRGYRS